MTIIGGHGYNLGSQKDRPARDYFCHHCPLRARYRDLSYIKIRSFFCPYDVRARDNGDKTHAAGLVKLFIASRARARRSASRSARSVNLSCTAAFTRQCGGDEGRGGSIRSSQPKAASCSSSGRISWSFSIHALEQTHRLPVGLASACKNRLMNIPSEK